MHLGSNLTKKCLVFVPGIGMPIVEVFWLVKGQLIFKTDPSERIYTSVQRSESLRFLIFILSAPTMEKCAFTDCCSYFTPLTFIFLNSSWTENATSTTKGMWLERLLTISELKAEDFNLNYTCRAYSFRGCPEGYFTLLPAGNKVLLIFVKICCNLLYNVFLHP